MNLSWELETPRLRLRPFALRDAEAMYALLRDPVVNTFLPWFPTQTLAEAEEMLRSRYIGGPGVHYAVCLRGEDAPIGYVSLAEGPAYDLGYGLARAHWGQGGRRRPCGGPARGSRLCHRHARRAQPRKRRRHAQDRHDLPLFLRRALDA